MMDYNIIHITEPLQEAHNIQQIYKRTEEFLLQNTPFKEMELQFKILIFC